MKRITHRLRHRVSFEEKYSVRDSDGMVDESWVQIEGLENVPAEVLTGPGREAIPADQPVSTVAARITVRYLSRLAIPHGLRIIHRDDIYHVETFYMDATGTKQITMVCSKGEKYV
jgi:SPP1 family predicted phage head-tail adaptor